MNLGDIADELEAIGLDRDQARLYVQMLHTGPAKASTLSSTIEFSRTKVYRLLDKMVEDGLVRASVTQPTIYTAIPAEEMFDKLLVRWQRGAERTEEVRHLLLEDLRNLSEAGGAPPEPTWRIIQGSQEVLQELHDLVDHAEESVQALWICDPSKALSEENLRILEGLAKRAAEGGVGLQAVLDPGSRIGEEASKWGTGEGTRIRWIRGCRPVRQILVDGREVLLFMVRGDNGHVGVDQHVALHTNAPGPLDAGKELFDAIWADAVAQPEQLAEE